MKKISYLIGVTNHDILSLIVPHIPLSNGTIADVSTVRPFFILHLGEK